MLKAKDMTYIAICVAIMAVCSWISIPLPVIVFTMQTFAVSFCAFFLGFKRSLIAIFAYLILGGVGVPIFNSFTAGFGTIVGPTGGFLVGFIPMVMVISFAYKLAKKSFIGGIIAGALGLIALYIVGVPWLAVVTMGEGQQFFEKLLASFISMLPFLFFDFLKMLLALSLTKFTGKYIKID